MADAAMCSAVAPALTGFVFAWKKRSAHYWQTFAVHFHRLVTLKPYFPICNQSGPCQRNPEGSPPKNQDIPETESNQSLVSAKLLMCSFRSCFAQKNQLSPKSPARIASADHFLSPKSPAFCNNGRCRHVLSCGPRFERFYCFGESSCALLAVLRTRLQSVFVAR